MPHGVGMPQPARTYRPCLFAKFSATRFEKYCALHAQTDISQIPSYSQASQQAEPRATSLRIGGSPFVKLSYGCQLRQAGARTKLSDFPAAVAAAAQKQSCVFCCPWRPLWQINGQSASCFNAELTVEFDFCFNGKSTVRSNACFNSQIGRDMLQLTN